MLLFLIPYNKSHAKLDVLLTNKPQTTNQDFYWDLGFSSIIKSQASFINLKLTYHLVYSSIITLTLTDKATICNVVVVVVT